MKDKKKQLKQLLNRSCLALFTLISFLDVCFAPNVGVCRLNRWLKIKTNEVSFGSAAGGQSSPWQHQLHTVSLSLQGTGWKCQGDNLCWWCHLTGQSLLDDIIAPLTKFAFMWFCSWSTGRGRKLQQDGADLTSVVVNADFLCKSVKVKEAVCHHRWQTGCLPAIFKPRARMRRTSGHYV